MYFSSKWVRDNSWNSIGNRADVVLLSAITRYLRLVKEPRLDGMPSVKSVMINERSGLNFKFVKSRLAPLPFLVPDKTRPLEREPEQKTPVEERWSHAQWWGGGFGFGLLGTDEFPFAQVPFKHKIG